MPCRRFFSLFGPVLLPGPIANSFPYTVESETFPSLQLSPLGGYNAYTFTYIHLN